MADPNEFDLEESLGRLNELWALTLENVINYVEHVDEAKNLFKEIKARGYKMIPADKLKLEELSQLNETGKKNVPELERIHLEKLELIKIKKFENMC